MRILLAVAALMLAACETTPDGGGKFSERMTGRWIRPTDTSCELGASISLRRGSLTVATLDSVRLHRITSDLALETRTVLIEPGVTTGVTYTFTPEFNATSDQRSFNLVMVTSNGRRETWRPCG